jgi:hypothetical protein
MQMKCESDKKEKELFEENKAANLRMQSKHEDFTKLSVNFEHVKGESQNLKAERDKLLQDIDKMTQIEATLQKEFKVQSEEMQTRQVKCGCAYMMHEPKTFVIPYSFQELVLQHERTIKQLEVQLHDETLLHQSIVKRHREKTQACSDIKTSLELKLQNLTRAELEKRESLIEQLNSSTLLLREMRTSASGKDDDLQVPHFASPSNSN